MKGFRDREDEEIDEIIRYINEECNRGAGILVEGVSDREALLTRGVRGRILTLHELYGVVKNDVGGLRLITLLDLDREGESILRRLEARFSNFLRLDHSARMRLRKTMKYRRGLRTIHQIFMSP
ncbi:hypothetical protein HRbin02_00679 [Candidatus Calditenuaceae archaeon HR02]|nr:hypothetical protein HRbin02_00679 [Candidatus Calditenuaceae archaeon HR02]